MILSIVILLMPALLLPFCMGAGVAVFVKKQERNLCFMWMAGTLLNMALFQLVSVPMILQGEAFSSLVQVYLAVSVVVAIVCLLLWFLRARKIPKIKPAKQNYGNAQYVLWAIFGAALLLQLVMAVLWAYGDGDDAYYVAESTAILTTEKMYTELPYTGGSTILEIRHCLAPFPVWIAYLAKLSGIHPATVAHVAMPLLLIPLTYCIYGMIGYGILAGKRRFFPAYMIFVSILVMWGNYSLYTAETFLITRTRQGKAALGNLVIPACIYLLYLAGERMNEGKKMEKGLWILLFSGVTAACLCSTLGGFLMALLFGVFGLCTMVSYKKFGHILPLILCLIPACVYIGLYLML